MLKIIAKLLELAICLIHTTVRISGGYGAENALQMAAKFLLADTCVAGAHSSGWDSDSCDTFLPHPALPYNQFA